MAKNALLLHGVQGSPQSNWLPWLANRLSWRGYEVTVPQLPQADQPDVDLNWDELKNFSYGPETVIVGHSSGAVMALKILERLRIDERVDRVYAVSAFPHDVGANGEALFKQPWDADRAKRHARKIELWWASDDAYVSQADTDELSQTFGIKPRVFPPGYGHFNLEVDPRFEQFPELADAIVTAGK